MSRHETERRVPHRWDVRPPPLPRPAAAAAQGRPPVGPEGRGEEGRTDHLVMIGQCGVAGTETEADVKAVLGRAVRRRRCCYGDEMKAGNRLF